MKTTSRIWTFSIQLSPKGPWITSQRKPTSILEAAAAAGDYLVANIEAGMDVAVKLTRVAPQPKPSADPTAEFPPDQTLRHSHRQAQTDGGED